MHNLYNKNCLEVLKSLEDESIDLIVTDPPYKLTSRGCSGSMGGYWKTDRAKKGTVFKYNDIPFEQYIPEFYRVLKNTSHCYIMCNNKNLQELINVATKCGFKFVKSLIWEKNNKICGKYYMGCYEYILLFRKGTDKPINKCGTPDILKVPIHKHKDQNGKNLHDTEKPLALMKILIENSSNEGETVLDPFMGICPVGVACKQLNRQFIGCEIDKRYYDVAVERMK